jgi:2-methylfumaryl-CoA hydratase
VHFDALQTEGIPLVYGGFPMSIGYAQSYSGMENRMGIGAINGGTHSNPVHRGDTLFSFTDVLNVAPISEDFGALRLRLFVVKNERPDDSFKPMIVEGHKQRYHHNVVLDLDYWEIMARKEIG